MKHTPIICFHNNRILKANGVLGYITPNKYLSATYGKGLREYCVKNMSLFSLMDISRLPVFDAASVYPIISLLIKCKQTHEVVVTKPHDLDDILECKNAKRYSSFLMTICPDYIWGFFLSDQIALLQKAFSSKIHFENIADINATSTAGEAESYGSHFTDTPVHGDCCLKVVNTGTM